MVELTEAQRGGSYYGLGSPEVRGAVELEGGRRYELEVEYPAAPDEPLRGFTVGARAVPSGDDIERAVAAAAEADVAVVIVGTDDDWETEGEDRTTMALPGDQDELVAAVAAANPNTIVVVNAGSPVTMPWLDAVPAVLQIWFPGQELGDALADVLTGVEEPGGRLPVTFPVRLEDTPAFAHHPGRDGRAVYAEGTFIGHRWYDREGIAPLFPFGHGLGYTTFAFGEAAVEGRIEDGVTVSVDVTNTGDRAGSEVVQVYVEPPPGDPARPLRHLAAFRRVDLAPGASVTRAASSSTGGHSPRGSTVSGPCRPVTTGSSSGDLSRPQAGWHGPLTRSVVANRPDTGQSATERGFRGASRPGRGRRRQGVVGPRERTATRRTRCAPTAATGGPTR